MNRVVALVSLLIAILSAYGQQQVQWYDVSSFAPKVKQCSIAFTDDKLFVYVNTGDKDINFWVGEPQRTGALMILNGNDMMEYRQAFFNEFIEQSLNDLPANATVQQHVQPNVQQGTEEYDADPLANLDIDVQPVDKELLKQGLSNEEILDYYAKQNENSLTSSRVGDTDNTMSGVMEQSGSGQSQQQGSRETKQSGGNGSGLEGILENILMLVIGYWLLKAVLKGFFGSSKSSKNKDYEDGPAWFHDHNQSI